MLGTIVGIHLTLFLAVNFISKEEDELNSGKFVRKLKYIDFTESGGKDSIEQDRLQFNLPTDLQSRAEVQKRADLQGKTLNF